jgi:hypothetical protein
VFYEEEIYRFWENLGADKNGLPIELGLISASNG